MPVLLSVGCSAGRDWHAPPEGETVAGAAGPTWDLTPLFADEAAWRAERDAWRSDLDELERSRGTIGQSPRALRRALDAAAALGSRQERLAAHARLVWETDLRIAASQARVQEARDLKERLDQTRSWMDDEILALGGPGVERFLDEDSGLGPHAFPLRRLLRLSSHRLGPEAEAILVATEALGATPLDLYQVLTAVDMPWPTILLSSGESLRLDGAGFLRGARLPAREDRRAAYQGHFTTWRAFRATLARNLDAHVRAQVLRARQRRYPSVLDMVLARDAIPGSLYTTLVAASRQGLPSFHRYLRVRARALGLARLEYFDLAVPLAPGGRRWSLPDMRTAIAEAMQRPLGAPHAALATEALDPRWLDVAPRAGKGVGAWCQAVHAAHPYLFINSLSRDVAGLRLLAHEGGHALHGRIAAAAQPFQTYQAGLLVSELAALLHELLVQDHLLEHAESDAERFSLAGEGLEHLREYFYSALPAVEQERAIYDEVAAGGALDPDVLSARDCAAMRAVYGADQGLVDLDPVYCHDWAFWIHYYDGSFYNHVYPVAVAGAAWFAERLSQDTPGERERVLGLLAAGGSGDPMPLLAAAGFDPTRAEAYDALFRRTERLAALLEALVARGTRPMQRGERRTPRAPAQP